MGKSYNLNINNSEVSVYNPFLYDSAVKFAEFGGRSFTKKNNNFSLNACYYDSNNNMNVVCVAPTQDGTKYTTSSGDPTPVNINEVDIFGKKWYYFGGIYSMPGTNGKITYGNLLNSASFMNKSTITLAEAVAFLVTHHAIRWGTYNNKTVIKLTNGNGIIFDTPSTVKYTTGNLNTKVSSIVCKTEDGTILDSNKNIIKGTKVYFTGTPSSGFYINTEYGNTYNDANKTYEANGDFTSAVSNIYAAYSCTVSKDSNVSKFSVSFTKQNGSSGGKNNITDSQYSFTNIPAGNSITISAIPVGELNQSGDYAGQYTKTIYCFGQNSSYNTGTLKYQYNSDVPSGYGRIFNRTRVFSIAGGTGEKSSGTSNVSITSTYSDSSNHSLQGYTIRRNNSGSYWGNITLNNANIGSSATAYWGDTIKIDNLRKPDTEYYNGSAPPSDTFYNGARIDPSGSLSGIVWFSITGNLLDYRGVFLMGGSTKKTASSGEFYRQYDEYSYTYRFDWADNTTYTAKLQYNLGSFNISYSGNPTCKITYANGSTESSANKTFNMPAGNISLDVTGSSRSQSSTSWSGWKDYKSGSWTSCLAGDTMITLADGSKKEISLIRANELIKTYNFDTGLYEDQYVLFVTRGDHTDTCWRLYLKDETYIDICGNHHDIYDPKAGVFRQYGKLGISKVSEKDKYYVFKNKKAIKIIGIEKIKLPTYCYAIATTGTLSVIANDILVGFGYQSGDFYGKNIKKNKWTDKFRNDLKTCKYTYEDFKDWGNKSSKFLYEGMSLNLMMFSYDPSSKSSMDGATKPFDSVKEPDILYVTLKNGKKSTTFEVKDHEFVLPKLGKKYKKWYNLADFKEYNENEKIRINASTVIKAI